jgi:hypothetical protein
MGSEFIERLEEILKLLYSQNLEDRYNGRYMLNYFLDKWKKLNEHTSLQRTPPRR